MVVAEDMDRVLTRAVEAGEVPAGRAGLHGAGLGDGRHGRLTEIGAGRLAVSAEDGRLTGRVLSQGMNEPIVAASVTVVGPVTPERGTFTDSLGRFTLDSIVSGDYVVRARAIGYIPRQERLVVFASPGPALDLELAPAVLDGPCGGFMAVRVRKPWWKWW